MNNQEFFSKTILHLRKQQAQSKSSNDLCCYRAGTLSCAIGCHIPDTMYNPDMEGTRIHQTMQDWPELQPLFVGVSLRLMDELQGVHDCYLPHAWEFEFKRLAKSYNLELPK